MSAVVVVGLGLIAAAVRVALLDPTPRGRTAVATQEASPPPPAPEPVRPAPRPPRPPRPAPRQPEPEPEPAPEPPPPPAPAHASTWVRGATEKVRVQRVVDGDSFETGDGRRVRLIGIDTPDPQHGPVPQPDAAAALAELLAGREVTLELDRERVDSYQRTLAWVHVGDLFVNGELVRRGLAWCSLWEPNLAHADELVGWQREARQARAGVWALPPPPPAEQYVAVRGQHRFHRPGCKYLERVEAGRQVRLPSRDAALDQGDAPCKECRP